MTLPLATPLKIVVQVSFSSDGAALIRPTFFFYSLSVFLIRLITTVLLTCLKPKTVSTTYNEH